MKKRTSSDTLTRKHITLARAARNMEKQAANDIEFAPKQHLKKDVRTPVQKAIDAEVSNLEEGGL